MAKELTPDQRRAQTRKEKYGDDFYKKIGSKGGKNNPKKFNSESGKAAINARWARHREQQSKKGNEE